MYLPIFLNISGKGILIVGGGRVAEQKLNTLSQFTKNITVVAPELSAAIKRKKIHWVEKKYTKQDLDGHFLVYACTNDRKANQQIQRDAKKQGVLINVADDPELCDFISPAVYKKGAITVAVSSGGKNTKLAIAWRDQIKESFKSR